MNEHTFLTNLNARVYSHEWLVSLIRFFANRFIWIVTIGVLAAVVVDPILLGFLIEESPEIILGVFLARGVFVTLLQWFIPRQRPYARLELMRVFVPHGQRAFPSGHATFFSSIGFFLLPIAPWAGISILVATALNGAARIAGALHWTSDVIAGFVTGYAGIYIAVEIFARLPAETMM